MPLLEQSEIVPIALRLRFGWSLRGTSRIYTLPLIDYFEKKRTNVQKIVDFIFLV
jgi:hypothetical protein